MFSRVRSPDAEQVALVNKIEQTITLLEYKGIIPKEGIFAITEDILTAYLNQYGDSSNLKKEELSFARKMAGLNLLKLNFSRGGTVKTCKEGLVYLIENPVYPGFLKIGMTTNLVNRLASYQMYDPLKRFKVKHYEFVQDRKRTEQNMLSTYNIHIESGEWIQYDDTIEIMRSVRENNWQVKMGV